MYLRAKLKSDKVFDVVEYGFSFFYCGPKTK